MSESLEQGKRKLTAKDAITAGALGASVSPSALSLCWWGRISPYVWFATHFIDAILIGPVSCCWWRRSKRTAPSSSRALSPA